MTKPTLARSDVRAAASTRTLRVGPAPVTRRQSAEAVGLLLGVLAVLFGLALTIGGPGVAGP